MRAWQSQCFWFFFEKEQFWLVANKRQTSFLFQRMEASQSQCFWFFFEKEQFHLLANNQFP
jgi:hypothetical protein